MHPDSWSWHDVAVGVLILTVMLIGLDVFKAYGKKTDNMILNGENVSVGCAIVYSHALGREYELLRRARNKDGAINKEVMDEIAALNALGRLKACEKEGPEKVVGLD